jgi:trk system potassium uptake protein TrkH
MNGLRERVLRLATPGRVVVGAFGIAVFVGSLLLALPISTTERRATFMEALFTATSALCVTGAVVVDTATFWTPFGQLVILVLMQIGAFGVMSLATLLGLLVARRLGLRTRLNTVEETHGLGFGDVRRVLFGVAATMFVIESVIAVVLAFRWWAGYGLPIGQSLWFGVFHSVAAFANAGFTVFPGNLVPYATDAWIVLPICAGVLLGGFGFPVLMELRARLLLPRKWTLNTVTVLAGSVVLVVVGWVVLTALEWDNAKTLGAFAPLDRLLVGFTTGIMPRSGGFNSIDIGQMHPASLLVTDILMFIGAGPAGTGGGIKITTFAVLLFVVVAEIRGRAAVNMFGKRLPRSTHREALTVALLSLGLVVGATLVILLISPFSLEDVLFEVISSFATVGLSTGITAQLPPVAQGILVLLMFIGRLGPVALGSSLALVHRARYYELPKERPIIG